MILEILDGWGTLAGAEFLSPRSFLPFFAKYLPLINVDGFFLGMVLRSDVFYEAEYRELCIQQLSLYQPSKMSLSYLKDLVETTHVFLKLMEHMSKTSHIMISSKKTKRVKPKLGGAKKPSKSGLTSGGGDGFISQRESNEQIWDTISLELSRILQDSSFELPDIGSPFDATSEIPIEDQRSHAMYRIQEFLKENKPAKAIALLRYSTLGFLF